MGIRHSDQVKIRQTKSYIQTGSFNVVKCSHGSAESKYHRDVKWSVCRYLYAKNIPFATEVTFMDGGRADIVVLTWGLVIEILHSESEKSYQNKKYPIDTMAIYSRTSSEEITERLDHLMMIHS